MIKIEPTAAVIKYIENKHYEDVKDRVIESLKYISNSNQGASLTSYLCDSTGNLQHNKLDKLILGNKNDLIKIIEDVGEVKIDKQNSLNKLYTNFINRKWAMELLKKLKVNVCPYCNRQYTFTLKKGQGIRPQFDHYFPQSKYPYLQVSLYNLIPSCNICNSKKGDRQPFDKNNKYNASADLLYPYEDEFSYDVLFETEMINNDFYYWMGISDNFEIKLRVRDPLNRELRSKVENVNEDLKIEELYNQHKDFVQDIIKKCIIYNKSRVNELLNKYPSLFKTESDVLNSIFMGYLNKEEWGKRPLSKLTYDIYKEFNLDT